MCSFSDDGHACYPTRENSIDEFLVEMVELLNRYVYITCMLWSFKYGIDEFKVAVNSVTRYHIMERFKLLFVKGIRYSYCFERK